MKLRLLDFLVCPISHTELKIKIWEEKNNNLSEESLNRIKDLSLSAELFEREIITGVLINEEKKIYYPIYQGVPRLLTYNCGVFEDFKTVYNSRIEKELKSYSTPTLTIPLGENSVIRSFSKEWLNYDWNPEKYWRMNSNVMYEAMRFMLDLENKKISNKSVLEIGIGIGGLANSFAKNENCELVGVDLGYAVDGAYKNFHNNLFLHIVQASAFNLPFKDFTFDYVYSHGVLHHSSDPKQCFYNVCKLTKLNGFLYVWLYSDTSENRNFLRRLIMIMEKVLRPIIWPLPSVVQNIALFPLSILYIIHQNFILANKDADMVNFSWREAFHAARDRFTPRYAFRYSEKELAEWFIANGYSNLIYSSKRQTPNYVTQEFCLATAIIGQKK